MKKLLRERIRDWFSKPAIQALVVIVFVVVFVFSWYGWVQISKSVHIQKIANELGPVGEFIGSLAANADGTSVSFFRGTETGVGLYVCDSTDGGEKLLYKDFGVGTPRQFGWSPDGNLLAFRARKNSENALLIYNKSTGEVETSVVGWIQAFTWLSPSSFVYFNGQLMRVDKKPDLVWQRPYHFAATTKLSGPRNQGHYPPISCLTTISPDSVVWKEANSIWEWKAHNVAPMELWSGSPSNQLLECSYSDETGEFLLHLADLNGEYIASYVPNSGHLVTLGRIKDASISNVAWINHGAGYAYLLNDLNEHALIVHAHSSNGDANKTVTIFGATEAITSGGRYIYTTACLDNQPKGIVDIDSVSGLAEYLVPNAGTFRSAKNIIPTAGTITNSFGSIHSYRLWSPAHFDHMNKYPLVLGQGTHGWFLLGEAAANADAYYIDVERQNVADSQITECKEDVMAAYKLMRTNPNVDNNQIYLCGSGQEEDYLVQLMNDEPALWRGAILHSPITFPDLARTRVTSMLIDYGEDDDRRVVEAIHQFQEDAAQSGIPVAVASHHSGRSHMSALSVKETIFDMMMFLDE